LSRGRRYEKDRGEKEEHRIVAEMEGDEEKLRTC